MLATCLLLHAMAQHAGKSFRSQPVTPILTWRKSALATEYTKPYAALEVALHGCKITITRDAEACDPDLMTLRHTEPYDRVLSRGVRGEWILQFGLNGVIETVEPCGIGTALTW